ncbi:alpha/beta hydrolase fold family protein [Rhodococcus sp. MTM3W5.2]|uniref:alpha/beta hydrolase family protein n=1 Tax=Rhodococcus sp. MTM3W5.2 TaxID=1805827 RepID=UPI0009796AC7|nr:alpha/beta fold hydrolase [Rhodococcus sp. MTM3W5.2]AQA25965.1 alpha/beta hydrolase fold family protein [Rhodococcus sp. MTM3W5.2]
MDTIPIQMPDGTTIAVRLFAGREAAPVVVIFPGLGVPGGFYDPVAEALVAQGFNAAVGELRGQGDSRPRPGADSSYGYQELASVDYPATFEVVRERFPDSTPYLLGHSMGGQLGVMYAARARGKLGGLILVASGSPYHRGHGVVRGAALLAGSAAMSVTANVAGFWPGDRVDVGGFGRQSKVLIGDWSRFARTGAIEPTGADIDYEERIGRLTLPVLSISMEDDDLAPRQAIKNLVAKMPKADLTTWHQPEPLGHNGWIRSPDSTVGRIVEWLHDRA